MLIHVKFGDLQKYVKLEEVEGLFDFNQFHEKVIEQFCLPPDTEVTYKDATDTEVDEEIFSDLLRQGNVVQTVFCYDEFSEWSSASDSSFNSNASTSTILMDEMPRKKQKTENPDNSVSAKNLVEGVLQSKSGGEEILQEYETTETLTDATRRQMVNILVAHVIDEQGHLPTKAIREKYAFGIVTKASLKDPYTKKGNIDQDFRLLFSEETSSRLLQKWDVFFKPNVIKEAKRFTSPPELRSLVQSAESLQSDDLTNTSSYDQEMASLLLLLHLLPPQPGGQKSPKISASDADERLVVIHKSCCSLEEHLRGQWGLQPYLLAVGRQKSKIDSFYIVMDKCLIPCQTNSSLGTFDELFKAHFVFNFSYDAALMNFYTFLQTTVYNIDVGKMKESPRVRDVRARLLNQSVELSCE
ncbi:uncharacterized protein LOC129365316 [Poeciliopsis prolifica]|uniref:uncharacterized protein LOC129365316 n=1 Tax=Poeciliopsis prolifica TaxID=188132 RepID=UPI002412F31E|nr:uncharacterized protein LOC129365316 [Poeciliopsis prolifica]